MNHPFNRSIPESNETLREALYRGEIFLLPPFAPSLQMREVMLQLLREELSEPIREAQFRLDDEDFFHHIGRLRKQIFDHPELRDLIYQLMREVGFVVEENALDPLRLRVITHRGHENPRAAPIYHVHRDTWYGHPPGQISWWIPLHDLREEETFIFFPEFFAQPVENDSAGFDYDQWIKDRHELRVGWQNRDAGLTAQYPAGQGDLSQAEQLSFSCRAGEVLLFAGAHLHQTRGNLTGQTRFSVDFRTVHLLDHQQGRGAPDVDNASTGSALSQYLITQ